jgi:hypothetical protein
MSPYGRGIAWFMVVICSVLKLVVGKEWDNWIAQGRESDFSSCKFRCIPLEQIPQVDDEVSNFYLQK